VSVTYGFPARRNGNMVSSPLTAHDAYRHAPAIAPRNAGGISRRSLLGLSRTKIGSGEIDFDRVTASVAAGWESDARTALLRAIEPVAAAIAERADITPDDCVLDVGAGDGNVARACAARGARVDACDLSEAMVRRGRARTGEAVAWCRADAQALPYADGRFDIVVSAFGAVQAPRAGRMPERTRFSMRSRRRRSTRRSAPRCARGSTACWPRPTTARPASRSMRDTC